MRVLLALLLVAAGCQTAPRAPAGDALFDPGGMVADARGLFLTATSARDGGVLVLFAPDLTTVTTVVGGDGVFTVGAPLAADGTRLYFAAVRAGQPGLYAMPRAGGAPELVAATPSPPSLIALGGARVFWAEGGAIFAAPLDGSGGARALATTSWPLGLASDGEYVYYSQSGGDSVGRVTATGGRPEKMAPVRDGVSVLAAGENFIYWFEGSPGTDCNPSGPLVRTSTLRSAGVATVVPSVGGGSALVVDGGDLFFAAVGGYCNQPQPTGSVVKIARDGAETVIADGVLLSQQVAVDAQSVYWTEVDAAGSGFQLRRAPR